MADESTVNGLIRAPAGEGAARLAMLSLEHCSDAIYWFDDRGVVVYANQAACRSLGYDVGEVVGISVTDLNPTYPADPMKWREALTGEADADSAPIPPWLKTLLVAGASQTYETVHRRKDGRFIPVEVLAAPIEIEGRRFIVASARDVSTRRWMESAVKNIASELDKFFEVSLEMLCITDQRGIFRRMNPSWERVLGFTPAELTSRSLFDFVHLDDRTLTLESLKQLTAQAAVASFANRFQKKSGGYCWLQWRCVPDGDRVYAAVRDVTSRMTAGDQPDGQAARSTPPADTAPPVAGSRGAETAAGQGAATSRPRVLVVEDNRLNQRVARQMLEHLGAIVELAGDGREAVESMRRGPDRFDAILMDMQMPDMDGLQATRIIRKEFPKHAVPIIAATASLDGADMTACLDAGMNDHVAKPIEPRQLSRVLSRWVTLPAAAPDRSEHPTGLAFPDDPLSGALTPLHGVDVKAALERLNGQRDLLLRLLRVFAQEHGKTTTEIESAIGREDFDGALRIVHNLKGVAGTLSATQVFEAARALETGLRDGQRTSLPGMVDRLGKALDTVCRSVSGWTGGTRTPRADESRQEPDRQLAAALMAEFDALLKNRRFSARARFEQLKEQLTLPELAPAIDQVQRCLDRLDFQQARELLPRIASTLGVSFSKE